LCNFLHTAVTSSLFCPNILLRTLFSKILSVLLFNVKDQVSHPWKTTCRIISHNQNRLHLNYII
jgi:hypothetical protein